MDSSPTAFLSGDPHDWSAEAAACQLLNPLDVFAEWLCQQPPRVQDMIAGEVCSLLRLDAIYRQVAADSRDWFVNLSAWLWSVPEQPAEILPRLLLLRAGMDLFAFAHRASADDWLMHGEEMALVAAKWGDHLPSNVVPVDPPRDAEKARQWIEAADSWRKLRNSVFGDEALSCWHEIACWQQG